MTAGIVLVAALIILTAVRHVGRLLRAVFSDRANWDEEAR